MKVVFVSNYFNHHQKPFCDAMDRLTNGRFAFVATAQMRQERRDLGYGSESDPGYVQYSYLSDPAEQACIRLINEAEIVIAGSAPEKLLKQRIRKGGLLLRYQERPFKTRQPLWRRLPHIVLWHLRNPRRKPIYMLCASGYTASDYRKIGLFRNRTYKWGYFPAVNRYELEPLFRTKEPGTLLWAGRFLDWKQPDAAVRLASRLKAEGCDFHLNMVGTGVMEQEIRDRIRELDLTSEITLTGPMKPEQVRGYMERAGIFLFTSNRQEGWGAVLNESMNSGCAVLANQAIGAVPFLLDHGENGYCYKNEDELFTLCKELLEDPEKQTAFGRNAYATVTGLWNAETAAKRLLLLAEQLKNTGACDLFETGPCSRA